MDIGKMFYNSDWFQYSSLVKQDLLLVQKRTNAPLKLTAAGFMDVNLNSYSNVSKLLHMDTLEYMNIKS